MKLKTCMALAVAAAFAMPLAAQSAAGDRILLATGPSGANATGTGMTGGTPGTQSSGEPRAPTQGAVSSSAGTGASTGASGDFSSLDRNGDGQISRAEWDAHYRSSSGASTGGTTSRAPSGPGTNSQAGAGSDTATTPGTSGKGKAQ
jgi:hypothetical protein